MPQGIPIDFLASMYRRRRGRFTLSELCAFGLERPPDVSIPAVYLIFDQSGEVIYVGQTGDVHERMYRYTLDTTHDIWKHGAIDVLYGIEYTEEDRRKIEKFLISLYNPVCNRQKPKPKATLGSLAEFLSQSQPPGSLF